MMQMIETIMPALPQNHKFASNEADEFASTLLASRLTI